MRRCGSSVASCGPRAAGDLRVLDAGVLAVPHDLHGVPDEALPAVATRVSSNPDAYVYLAESIRAWPDQEALARRIVDAGFTAVRWRNLTGGIAALHSAIADS